MEPIIAHCVYCERDNSQVPLLMFRYQESELWICSEHLPVLIHKPAQLIFKLPGAERLSPAEV